MNDIQPWDWKRILLGETPPQFLIEVFLRTLVVYLMLIVTVRLLGKRMSGQISISELAVMVMLGAIVSPGMQLPDRAILFVPVALIVILLFHTLINRYATRNEKLEMIVEGRLECLVKDGIMQLEAMRRVGITRQELFSLLRKRNVENLASVKRAYLEACGIITLFKTAENHPGLLVFPEKDTSIFSYKYPVDHGMKACCNCGHVQHTESENDTCEVCHKAEWIDAYQ